jgi:hypothetical protein
MADPLSDPVLPGPVQAQEVASALTTILTFLVGYFVPEPV